MSDGAPETVDLLVPGLHRRILLLLRSPIVEVAIEAEVPHEAEAIGTVAEAARSWMSDLTPDFEADPKKAKVAGVLGIGTSASHTTLMLVYGTVPERNVSCFLHVNHHHRANRLAIHGMLPTVMCVRSSTGRAPWPMRPCQHLHSKPSLRHSHLLLPCSALSVLPRHQMLRKHHQLVHVLSSKSARIGLAPPLKRPAMPGHLRPDPQTRSALRFQPAHVPKMRVFNQRLDHLSRRRNNRDRLVDNGSTLQSLPRAV